MIHLPSACLSIVLALALAPSIQAQQGTQEPGATPTDHTSAAPPATTATTEPATTVGPTTTIPITITTTTTVPPITTTDPIITTTTIPPVITTTTNPPTTSNAPPITTTSRDVPSVTRPTHNTNTNPNSSVSIPPTTTSGSNNANGSSSSTSPSSNVPVIVGSVVGVLALVVIVATSVICYKRRKRNNRELTFDTLEGMSGPALSSRRRASLNYLTSSSPVITSGNNVGLNSVPSAHGGYDENYDYEMQSNVGYPTPLQPQHNSAYHQQGVYDGYGSPHQGYRPSPTIFQEDAPYATASSMGRGRTGFDQNLPEVMYNRGEIDHDPTTGYYHHEDDIYDQAAWTQDQLHPHGGYVAEQGHWDAEAMLHQYDNEPELPLPPTHQNAMSTPSLDSTLIGSPGRPKNQNVTAHNPQAILESPILKSTTLRSGDLFGQEAPLGSSPRITTQQATHDLEAVGGVRPSSPRIMIKVDHPLIVLVARAQPQT
ncbi:hypothetical protein BGZ97_004023 [Linnemannia gamsii]|uniref:Uncharacterized protein n=1 Tax=Linnemannia gamsii TaxID=64522 RepID=A0A9P6UHA3_9FUNG|nr:hypothetical protein BGZ97_004023 [Linnemannia gamsii]